MDAFDVLGLGPTADQSTIDAAYRQRSADATPGGHAPAEIERAYLELCDPARRAALQATRATSPAPAYTAQPYAQPAAAPPYPATPYPSPQPTGPYTHPSPATPPQPGAAQWSSGIACKACGRGPATDFSFNQNTGMLLMRRYRTAKGRFCRDCARSVGRKFQDHNLLLGWWGTVSLFVNSAYVLGNTSNLVKAWRLGPPQPAQGRRHDPGRPVFLRPGGLVFLLGIVVLVVLVTAKLGSAAT